MFLWYLCRFFFLGMDFCFIKVFIILFLMGYESKIVLMLFNCVLKCFMLLSCGVIYVIFGDFCFILCYDID